MTDAMSTINKVKRFLEANGVSQNQAARESGVSAAALSACLKGTYAGDVQSLEEKLEKWLSASHRRDQRYRSFSTMPEWVTLPTSAKMFLVLEYAQGAPDIGVIYGAAGTGKTHSLKRYAEENPNVWVCAMTAAHAGVSPCLEEIALTLDMRGTPGRSARLFREIVRKIKDTNGLLVIDEAQHLLPSSLEVIRAIHDASGVGLVLCGNESVYARLTGGSRTATFAQLFSRIGKRLKITRPLKGDIEGIAKAFGIESQKAQGVLWDIGRKPGGLRGVVKTLRLAGVAALGGGKDINEGLIRAAWCELSGDVIG